jgi:hypothetical protein
VKRFPLGALPLAALLVAAGCAHVEAPTGGPVERRPLELLEARPADGAVIPRYTGPVIFYFEERLSERLLEQAVHVSPQTSPTRVRHRGRELRVELAQGWEPGIIYQVTVSPTIQDLFGNRLAEPVEVVFSTGPELPDTRLAGRVIDRITGRPERDARVEAVRLADSLVYALPSDTAGAFAFRALPEGAYEVRAYRDLNRNRRLDPLEPRDVTTLELRAGEPAALALRLVPPDTTPPRVVSARVERGVVEVTFDDYLEPEQQLSPAQVSLVAADGSVVGVARVAVGSLPPAPAADAPAPPPADAAPPAPPLPSRVLSIEPARALEPGARYNVVVRGIRNVVGLAGDGEASVEAPAAPPPAPQDGDEG